MDRETWQIAVHGIAQSRTRLKWLSTQDVLCYKPWKFKKQKLKQMSWGEGAWWTTVHGAAKESDTTEQLNNNGKKNTMSRADAFTTWCGTKALDLPTLPSHPWCVMCFIIHVGLLLLQVWCPHSRSQMVQWTKNSPAVQETLGTQVWSLGWEDPLEKEMATHSSILAWKIPCIEESGGLQSMGSQRVRHNWASKCAHT